MNVPEVQEVDVQGYIECLQLCGGRNQEFGTFRLSDIQGTWTNLKRPRQ